MDHDLSVGTKVIVTKIVNSQLPDQNFDNPNYPKLGWIGTIAAVEDKWNQYIISWSKSVEDNDDSGDLVYKWMVEPYVKDWDS